MRASSYSSAVGAAALTVLVALGQGPGTRLTYRVRVFEGAYQIAGGAVSGSFDTDLRFSLRSDSAEVEALFQVIAEPDSVHLSGEFFTKRRVSRSRRGLPLWEQDTYRRVVRLAWGDTARVDLSRSGRTRVEVVLHRGFSGGEARPGEEIHRAEAGPEVQIEAVVRPRRARVVMNLVRGDTVSGPYGMDLVPDAPARRAQLRLAGRATLLEVALARPEPPASARDRVLALDADVVCLRVVAPTAAQPVGVVCGRLNNVARRLPLPEGDTLMVTFAWPAGR